MSFNCVAFGIYMLHCTDEDDICKLLFKNIKIGNVIYSPENYTDIIDNIDVLYKFTIYDDIKMENINEVLPCYKEENNKLKVENNNIILQLTNEMSLRKIIKLNYLDLLDFRFEYENGIEFSIGYPHKCSFMIYSDYIDQWNYQRAFISEQKALLLYELRNRLINENRLRNTNEIGMIADCCI